jgi:hypothetical protein
MTRRGIWIPGVLEEEIEEKGSGRIHYRRVFGELTIHEDQWDPARYPIEHIMEVFAGLYPVQA